MIAIINLFSIHTVDVLFHLLVVMGLCPLVFLNVISVNPRIATITVLQKKNRFKDTLLKLACIFGSFNITDKYTQSILWIRIQILKLVCPITIGQTIFSLLLYGFYLHILARMMLAGSTTGCVDPLTTEEINALKAIDEADEQILEIKEQVIPRLLLAVPNIDRGFTYDLSTRLRFREGYDAMGYIWPNASLWQVLFLTRYHPSSYPEALKILASLNPQIISMFGSAFYSHFTDQIATLMNDFSQLTPEEARDRHIEAMQELKNALPFYLEFQLPGVNFLLRALEYPTEVSSFYNVSIVGKAKGIYHERLTSIFDPYCPSYDNTKTEIFVSFENRIRENFLRLHTEDNQSSKSSEELLNFSICKKEFLHQEFLKVKINKALVEQEHHYQLMSGGVMAVAIGYGIYKIAQIL